MVARTEKREPVLISSEDKNIFAILHLPLDQKEPFPAVLFCPGFAGTKSGKTRIGVRMAQELTKRGIAVLRFDYIGTGDSEGEFGEITFQSKVADAKRCLDFLVAHPKIDSTRLGVLGRSLGGAVAIVLSDSLPLPIKSIALWAPLFFSKPFLELLQLFKEGRYPAEQGKHFIFLPFEMPNEIFFKEFSALDIPKSLAHLNEIPLLHIQGEKDKVIDLNHAIGYEKERTKGIKNQFIRLPNSDHDFLDPTEQKIMIESTTNWFEETL